MNATIKSHYRPINFIYTVVIPQHFSLLQSTKNTISHSEIIFLIFSVFVDYTLLQMLSTEKIIFFANFSLMQIDFKQQPFLNHFLDSKKNNSKKKICIYSVKRYAQLYGKKDNPFYSAKRVYYPAPWGSS
jgi:hypothetical protein